MNIDMKFLNAMFAKWIQEHIKKIITYNLFGFMPGIQDDSTYKNQ